MKTLRAVSVHKAADKGAKVFGSLAGDKTVTLLGCDKGWCHVQFKGGDGYVSQDFLDLSGSGDATTMESSRPAAKSKSTQLKIGVQILDKVLNGQIQADASDASVANIAGVWKSHTDKNWTYILTLKQSGNKIDGTYVAVNDGSEGTMNGTITGNVFAFTWTQSGYKGSGSFTINGDSMDGQYSTEDPGKTLDPSFLTGTWHADRT